MQKLIDLELSKLTKKYVFVLPEIKTASDGYKLCPHCNETLYDYSVIGYFGDSALERCDSCHKYYKNRR